MTRTKTIAVALALLSLSAAPALADPLDCAAGTMQGTEMNKKVLQTAAGYASRIMGSTGLEWQTFHYFTKRVGECRWNTMNRVSADTADGWSGMIYHSQITYRPSDGKWFWEVIKTDGWSSRNAHPGSMLGNGWIRTPTDNDEHIGIEKWELRTSPDKPSSLPPG